MHKLINKQIYAMCNEKYLWIFRVCAGIVVLLILVGSIIFPIEASNAKCGFQLFGNSITMEKFNGTVVNSTILDNLVAFNKNMSVVSNNKIVTENDVLTSVTCTNIIEIAKINHTCNLIVYDGKNILKCIESIFPNGKVLEIFIEGRSEMCYLYDLSRDCYKSNMYSGFGLVCIIIMCIFIVIFFCKVSRATQEYRNDVDYTLYYRNRRDSESYWINQ